MINKYQVPDIDEQPSDEMVNWLHENPGEWYGDEYGIVLISCCGNEEYAHPGDWIVRDQNGKYHVEKAI